MENYERLINDDVFLQVLINNGLYALVTIPVAIALAIVMALLVNSAIPGRGLLRMSFFAPTMLPMIAVANIWLFFYSPGFGLLDQIRALPERYRETLAMRLVEGMTGPEIAQRTGLTEGSVRVNLCRGMKILRERLRKEGWP